MKLPASCAFSTTEQSDAILALGDMSGSNDAILDALPDIVGGSQTATGGISALTDLLAGVRAAGIAESRVKIDVSIARGLAYYTGTVFETFLDDLPAIGSVCSGGRYDDLASLYTKQRLPGIGGSLGVDRLLAAMEELGIADERAATAEVFLPLFVAERLNDYLGLAEELRKAGLDVELFPEARKLGAQMKYANRRGHRLAIIVGETEWAEGTAQIKDLDTGDSREVQRDRLVDGCRSVLEVGRGDHR